MTVISPRFLTGVDEPLLRSLTADHALVVTLEDGELDGGYGQRIASFYGMQNIRVRNLGISKAFHSDFDPETLLRENGISAEQIFELLKEARSYQ